MEHPIIDIDDIPREGTTTVNFFGREALVYRVDGAPRATANLAPIWAARSKPADKNLSVPGMGPGSTSVPETGSAVPPAPAADSCTCIGWLPSQSPDLLRVDRQIVGAVELGDFALKSRATTLFTPERLGVPPSAATVTVTGEKRRWSQ